MALTNISSPHAHNKLKTQQVMLWVVLATLPGLCALTYWFGMGTLVNLAIVISCSLAFEAWFLRLRKRPVLFYLKDNSALVTAILLGLSLPPFAPWWIAVLGAFFAIVLAKQLYGGLGNNPFNPAMVAYVILLISFTKEMSQWAAPLGLSKETMGFGDSFNVIFLGGSIDAFSGATPLDIMKQRGGEIVATVLQEQAIFNQSHIISTGWEWVNLGFLIGGLVLLFKKIFTWHAPGGMLLGLIVMAFLFDDGSSKSGGPVLMHLLSGATMLGAFFIITDPVSGATSNRGRFIFGIGVGVLVYIIRVWGGPYPDAVAFSVLLMNFAAPFIDYYTPPRTYGHKQSQTIVGKGKS